MGISSTINIDTGSGRDQIVFCEVILYEQTISKMGVDIRFV